MKVKGLLCERWQAVIKSSSNFLSGKPTILCLLEQDIFFKLLLIPVAPQRILCILSAFLIVLQKQQYQWQMQEKKRKNKNQTNNTSAFAFNTSQ